jgi:DNA-binding transcriptional regulator YhcF (GntR family)
MSSGFGAEKIKNGKAVVVINDDEVNKILKEYKKIKKYMRSSLYKVKSLDGTEDVVKNLLDEYGDDVDELI